MIRQWLWPPVRRAATSSATWFFAAVWLAAVGVLAARGQTDRALGAPVVLVALLFFCWLTALLTEEPAPPQATSQRPRATAQLAIALTVVALTGILGVIQWGIGPPAAPAAASDVTLELLLPLVLLLLLGVSWRELGFGNGHRVGRVLALWCIPQLINVIASAASNGIQPATLLGHFVRNAFQNGPVEEFLFRGALLSRLSLLVGGGWGLVLSALVFGVWHVGANTRFETHGDFLNAACAGITGQAPYGLAFGVIFQRTRNLLAGSVFHMVLDLP